MGSIQFNVGNGGLGRTNPSTDVIGGLMFNGVSVFGGLGLNIAYKLRSLQDAIALGITPDYDNTNTCYVWLHIYEYFRLSNNAPLWIYAVAKTVPYADMLDVNTGPAIEFLRTAGEIDHLAVAYNPATAVTDFTATAAAIPKAQDLAQQAFDEHIPCHILLEGKGFSDPSTLDLHTLDSKYVSVVVGQLQSNSYYNSADLTQASVGVVLGVVSSAQVNECIGWVGKFDISSADHQSALVAGADISSISPSTQTEIEDNGYIYFKKYSGKSGFFINDSQTAVTNTDDFATIENVRTVNKAVRLLYQALLPFVNSPVIINSTTGQIAAETIAFWEATANKAINVMFQNQEISGPDPLGPTPPVQINPEQNVLANSQVQVQLNIVPTGTARVISVFIAFTNPNG